MNKWEHRINVLAKMKRFEISWTTTRQDLGSSVAGQWLKASEKFWKNISIFNFLLGFIQFHENIWQGMQCD